MGSKTGRKTPSHLILSPHDFAYNTKLEIKKINKKGITIKFQNINTKAGKAEDRVYEEGVLCASLPTQPKNTAESRERERKNKSSSHWEECVILLVGNLIESS